MVRIPGPDRLVLASASPRRLELLAQIGIEPKSVSPADIDETPLPRELPGPLAKRLAGEKAAAAARLHPQEWILSADTVVGIGRRVLGKPEDAAEARRFLGMLSGRRHRVYGGVCVRTPEGRFVTRLVTTAVAMKRLEGHELDEYAASGEWRGKAGGYAIQGRAGAFVTAINGSYFNVVGLPLYETLSLLRGLGFHPPAVAESE